MTEDASARDALQGLLRRFVRGFGLLAGDQTPCGQPLPTSHAHALQVLRLAPKEGLSQAALGAALKIDKSNVSRLVARLTAKGYLREGSAQQDARVHTVRLTAKGERLSHSVEEASRQRFDAVLSAIEPSRRAEVLEAIEVLVHAVEHTCVAPASQDGA